MTTIVDVWEYAIALTKNKNDKITALTQLGEQGWELATEVPYYYTQDDAEFNPSDLTKIVGRELTFKRKKQLV